MEPLLIWRPARGSIAPRPRLHLLLLFTAALLAGCGRKQPLQSAKPDIVAPVHVQVFVAQNTKRATMEEALATVRAKLRATLEAKVSGRISSMPVLLGQRVSKDQLLVRLDAGEIQARLDQTQAAFEQAERDWRRSTSLLDGQAISRSEFDSAESRLRVAKAAKAEAHAMLGYLEVTAPFDGLVTKKWVDVGDLATPGKPLLHLEVPSVLQLEADLPEGIASRIKPGDKLQVKVDTLDKGLTATLTEMALSADPFSRTFRVKLDLPEATGLMPGQFARLLVPTGECNCVSIPASALVQRGQLEIVFVLANQRARMRLVKSGQQFGKTVEILSGLEAGEQVVVEKPALLVDGQLAEVK